MANQIPKKLSFTGEGYDPIARLWCLRSLAAISAGKAGSRRDISGVLQEDDVAELLGYWPPHATELLENGAALVARWNRQAATAKVPRRGPLFDNARAIGDRLGLTETDREILALIALSRACDGLREALQSAGRMSDARAVRLLAKILTRDRAEVRAALEDCATLRRARLIRSGDRIADFEDKFPINDELVNALMRRHESVDGLLSFATARSAAPMLTLADYAHVAEHLEILVPYLVRASAARDRGVNVLLYGGAGNGKTELAKAIAHQTGLALYEVRHSSDDGSPLRAENRIDSYALMQAMLTTQRSAAILFDEIEDILPSLPGWLFGADHDSGRHKAWLNRTLEDNPVPAIWIGNDVSRVDPAYLRRFDYVMELGPPPRNARMRMLRAALKELPASDAWLERKAEERDLSPGILVKIARVLARGDAQDPAAFEKSFDLLARARRQVRGIASQGAYPYPANYRVDLLNASADPLAVASRLAARGRANLLLYGPPGTGKTAYAHFLSRHLGRPLMVRRASDLVSMWVGQTEKQINNMFREAADDNALLLLDEADSFLLDRRTAQHSWEVTQVNELLTRMEEFEGIFVCATNFSSHLDQAAMRRFAVKVRFDALRPQQALSLFGDTLAALGNTVLDGADMTRAQRELVLLAGLTPGDFAAAQKAVDLDAYPRSASGLLEALRAELAAKPDGGRRPIGFTA